MKKDGVLPQGEAKAPDLKSFQRIRVEFPGWSYTC
jgi:hypothetical protein